jgi:hypothetical protein
MKPLLLCLFLGTLASAAPPTLPDFSRAGYRCGEQPLPELAVTVNVKKFGAIGDGRTDDTAAFRKAVTEGGVIFIPAGRYVLTDTVRIERSGVVLRGAGADKTVLVIPKSLQQIHPKGPVDEFKSPYSFGGAFIEVSGGEKGKKLSAVATSSVRGTRQVTLHGVSGVKVGDWLRFTMNNFPALGRHIHANKADVGTDTQRHRSFFDWVARVTAVNGNTVTLDRALRLDLRPEWEAEAWTWQPTVQEVGIEDVCFVFPGVPKKPHLKEEGFNAIHMRGVANSWVRRVRIVDADNGVTLGGCRFCQIDQTQFVAVKRKDPSGHHALWATGSSQDCLFSNFEIKTKYVHDLTVEGFANGNVFMKGRGVAMNFDHHRNAPYENLFTELNVGDPRRLWESGGRDDRGPHSGARATFWNIRAGGGKVPSTPDWPEIITVGVCSALRGQPPNLYDAQRSKR